MLNIERIDQVGEKTIIFRPISVVTAAKMIIKAIRKRRFNNAVGHVTSGKMIASQLMAVTPLLKPFPKGRRHTVRLSGDDLLIVAQHIGPRLPEGAIKLPEESKIKYWLVIV